jgi:Dynamin family
MRAEDLQNYIARFRKWLDLHAAPALQARNPSLVTTWREELSAAERLLEHKPELPIALLGPSQQGKSSLINAIVGETILPVGGAVGACTCVITSVHHRLGDGYRAEIDFISLQDWAAELIAMRDAASTKPEDDDTDLDREEREAVQKAALEKFGAVYRGEQPEKVSAIFKDVRLGLPDNIARAMSSGQPLVIAEDKPIPLRNKIRRYLVGREQYEEGQYWPLISRVRIYGNFKALSNGVVLVDLPGLNDPNPARERVTKEYMEEARYVWLVCNSQTGIDRVLTQTLRENGLLFRLFLEGRLDVFSVIATRIDDMNLEAVLTQMGGDTDDFDGSYGPILQYRRTEIASHVQRNLTAIAEDIAAKADAGEYRGSFFDRVRSIPVFSISTNGYLHAIDRMPLYQGMKFSPEETHVPKLINHLQSVTLEQSYKTQIEAALRRLRMLHDQARRFFLNAIQRIEADSDQA